MRGPRMPSRKIAPSAPDAEALQLLHQLQRPGDGAAGREEVVDGAHPRARLDRVLVHLQCRGAVFEVVFDAHDVRRKLAELADGDEPDPELVGDRSGEDEPARFHPDDGVDGALADLREQSVDRRVERGAVLEEGGDVLEEDPRLWKIGNATDL